MTGITRPVVERLRQLYRHDLSEFRGSLPDVTGAFHTRPLEPFLDGEPAGPPISSCAMGRSGSRSSPGRTPSCG